MECLTCEPCSKYSALINELNEEDMIKSEIASGRRIVYDNGDYYCGHSVRGVRQGHGTYFHKNGDIYEGEWMDGKKHGFGTHTIPEQPWTGKFVYEGEWNEDKKHGKAKVLFTSGDRFEGEYANDDLLFGVYESDLHGGFVFEGGFKNGKYEVGKVTYRNGDVYEGQWTEEGKEGRFTLCTAAQEKFIVMFSKGKEVSRLSHP